MMGVRRISSSIPLANSSRTILTYHPPISSLVARRGHPHPSEALAYGIPVISTNVAGIPEMVRHGKEGFLVPPFDVEMAVYAMDSLYRDEGGVGAVMHACCVCEGERDAERSMCVLVRLCGY